MLTSWPRWTGGGGWLRSTSGTDSVSDSCSPIRKFMASLSRVRSWSIKRYKLLEGSSCFVPKGQSRDPRHSCQRRPNEMINSLISHSHVITFNSATLRRRSVESCSITLGQTLLNADKLITHIWYTWSNFYSNLLIRNVSYLSPDSIDAFLPQGYLVVSARNSQYISWRRPAESPNHIRERLCCQGLLN